MPSILTILNIPSLEYRNFVVSEYQNKTIISKKPLGPVRIEKKDDKISFILYNWPINDFKFNNMIFSNLILYSKIFDIKYVSINKDLIIETDFIFPQTGIGRLIYLNNKKIDSGNLFINNFSKKFNVYLKIIYFLGIMLLLIIYLLSFIKCLKKNRYD